VSRPKVVVTHWVHDVVLARLASSAFVEPNPTRETWPREEVRRRCADAFGMIAFMPDQVDETSLASCPRLKIIACALKGFDNFDLAATRRAGVALSIVPDLLTEPTAELAVGLVIALQRHVIAGDTLVRSGRFNGWRPMLYGSGLDGSTVAIIGLGAVGAAIARRLAGFGCRIVGYDPAPSLVPAVESVPLDRAVALGDTVILAAPLTAATRGMIDARAIAAMKPGARLVNVGRGSVVDESAVAEALEQGRLGGYAADVFAFEDWALADRPRAIEPRLLAQPATVFTPHLGSAVEEVRQAIAMRAAENVIDVIEGREPRDRVG
jgi:phosphonate dehydrogenase